MNVLEGVKIEFAVVLRCPHGEVEFGHWLSGPGPLTTTHIEGYRDALVPGFPEATVLEIRVRPDEVVWTEDLIRKPVIRRTKK